MKCDIGSLKRFHFTAIRRYRVEQGLNRYHRLKWPEMRSSTTKRKLSRAYFLSARKRRSKYKQIREVGMISRGLIVRVHKKLNLKNTGFRIKKKAEPFIKIK